MCLRIDHPFKRSFAHHSSIPIRPRPHQTRGACYVIALTASPSQVKDAYKLATNEALVVYCEKAEGVPANCEPSKGPLVKGAAVERRIVTGPAIFVPSARDWIHQFSWHGSPGANGTGSKTGTPGDTKIPHGVEFEKLRCMLPRP